MAQGEEGERLRLTKQIGDLWSSMMSGRGRRDEGISVGGGSIPQVLETEKQNEEITQAVNNCVDINRLLGLLEEYNASGRKLYSQGKKEISLQKVIDVLNGIVNGIRSNEWKVIGDLSKLGVTDNYRLRTKAVELLNHSIWGKNAEEGRDNLQTLFSSCESTAQLLFTLDALRQWGVDNIRTSDGKGVELATIYTSIEQAREYFTKTSLSFSVLELDSWLKKSFSITNTHGIRDSVSQIFVKEGVVRLKD